MTTPTFEEYRKPMPGLLYSVDFFIGLSFEQATSTTLPPIAPLGTLLNFEFSPNVPTDPAEFCVNATDIVPNHRDLLPVTNQLQDQFKNGARSVILQLSVNGMPYLYMCHFSKISLYQTIYYNLNAVSNAHRILDMLHPPILPNQFYDQFKAMGIHSPMCGFLTSSPPLWKLTDLLDEVWLEDSLVNMALEIIYFAKAVSTISLTRPSPPHLVLPTHFYEVMEHQHQSFPNVFTPNITAIRKRVQLTAVHSISHVRNHGFQHYTGGHQKDGGNIVYGDSLKKDPPESIASLMSWALTNVSWKIPSVVQRGDIDRQGIYGGAGSCGIHHENEGK